MEDLVLGFLSMLMLPMAKMTYLKLEHMKENVCITNGNWQMSNHANAVLFHLSCVCVYSYIYIYDNSLLYVYIFF